MKMLTPTLFPWTHHRCLLAVLVAFLLASPVSQGAVNSVSALVLAVNQGEPGDTIEIAAGTYILEKSLEPKRGMTLRGAGMNETILTASPSWDPGTQGLPDGDVRPDQVDRSAYLINLGENTPDVTISHLTLTGPKLHGAIFGFQPAGLEIHDVRFRDFTWSGVRTFGMENGRIHGNDFINAGGRVQHNGGAIYFTWMKDSEIWNNRIRKTPSTSPHFGIKGRQAKRSRIHHNTILVNFSIELPFENDEEVEIDHNYLEGAISIPKHGGGAIPDKGHTFHIHHNYFTTSYALEWSRNCAKVDHNLFDFDTQEDGGNLISTWTPDSPGPTEFHDNLIKNPGRGVFWTTHVYDNFCFYNNHVITNTTATPRREGLFGFNPDTDFSTIVIKNNIIECNGLERPLMRNEESYQARIRNNTLINVSDTANYANSDTGEKRGPRNPLHFQCGAYGEFTVDDWEIRKNPDAAGKSPQS